MTLFVFPVNTNDDNFACFFYHTEMEAESELPGNEREKEVVEPHPKPGNRGYRHLHATAFIPYGLVRYKSPQLRIPETPPEQQS
jgi:hypothetical protein